jgi:hypothetical protein
LHRVILYTTLTLSFHPLKICSVVSYNIGFRRIEGNKRVA